jgi:hypothetical protein
MNKSLKSPAVEYGKSRLANKKTGKLASSSTWLLDLAACAITFGHSTGIASALPLTKAERLLNKNNLKNFTKHQKEEAQKIPVSSHADLRAVAEAGIPAIVVFYIENVVGSRNPKTVNRKGFTYWLAREIAYPGSQLNLFLLSRPELVGLAEIKRSERWWVDRLKMQSKLHKAS